MNITTQYPITIFKNNHNGMIYYQAGISKKLENGTYENSTILVQFKKGIELDDRQKIVIKKGFLSFWKKDKITNYKVVITDFEKVMEKKQEVKEEKVEVDPFADFGKMVETDDNFLE